ncbi:MAG: hypothetical protein J0H01_34140 [Rhizobiales bacterium]|nr:hypothetical protein [Hyphomicrobiales bacterium]
MTRLAALAATTLSALFVLDPALAGPSRPHEMQAQRGGALTPQRARAACWQELGFGPTTPRDRYPARLLPQVEQCIQRKLGR